MIFSETPLGGAFVVDPQRIEDERGFFARLWCRREFEDRGLDAALVQWSMSFNKRAGTLRGMHYQVPPSEEIKLVRCTKGSVFDVIIDLRPKSSTFTKHFAVTLSSDNRRMLYIPKGFAHGFQTLEDESEVMYQMSAFYDPATARGVRWDDPLFAIAWPPSVERTMNARDRSYPDFQPLATERA